MLFKKYTIALFLLVGLALPPPLFAATSLVVQSVHSGLSDEASDKTANILREKLAEKKSLILVDPKKVEAILAYYQNFQQKTDTTDAAQDLLNRAKEHYFQFAYADAAAELEKVSSLLQPGQSLLDCYLTEALVHAAQKNSEAATHDFVNALRLNPFYKLDAKAFAPSVHKLFQQAETEIGKEALGELEIVSDPKVAEVYLNGIYQGVAPLKLTKLPEGNYTLRFQANNYQSIDQSISVRAEQKLKLHPKLYWGGIKKIRTRDQRIETAHRQIEEGLRIAGLLKVDKVLLVAVDDKTIAVRLIDRRFRASQTPIIIGLNSAEDLEGRINKLVDLVVAQTELDLRKNPQAYLDPQGLGDPILLGKSHKKFPKGILFGGLGAIVAGGVLTGILLSGGAATPQTGSLALSFR